MRGSGRAPYGPLSLQCGTLALSAGVPCLAAALAPFGARRGQNLSLAGNLARCPATAPAREVCRPCGLQKEYDLVQTSPPSSLPNLKEALHVKDRWFLET